MLGLGDKGTLLVVCAHPDDELAVPGTLREVARRGHGVRVLFATSGEASETAQSGPQREDESTRALTLLGIPQEHLTFLRLPDGGLVHHLPALTQAVRRAIATFQPRSLLCPAFEGGHTDHDAVNAAVHHARRGTATVHYEFPTYSLELVVPRTLTFSRFAPPGGPLQTFRADDHEALFRAVKACYPSQQPLLDRLENVADIPALLRRGETVRTVARDRDHTRAPGTRPLLYEVMGRNKLTAFATFRRAVRELAAPPLLPHRNDGE